MFLSIGHLLIISFLFLTSINCVVTYFCSSSALKELEKTKSFNKAINKIRVYDTYILITISLLTSAIYVVLSYFYFLESLEVSDYFITLSVSMGFILSLITTFFSRLCYCYVCNVLLKTQLNEYECFKENFFYLLRIFFPIFLVSFVISSIYLLPIKIISKKVISVLFIVVYLVLWVFSSPYKTIFTLNARKINNKVLKQALTKIFNDNEVKKYQLYYWDSSKTNEANALISGFFTRYLFVSTSLIESLNIEELQAVVLHEIGHVKNHHFTKILISKIALLGIFSFTIYYALVFDNVNIWLVFALTFIFILTMGINLKGSKRYEEEADLYVNEKGYGIHLISALKKVSFEDTSISKLDEFFSSHPDTNKRIEKLNNK